MTINLLVIEDSEKHLADAKMFFGDKEDVNVTYATTFMESQRYLGDRSLPGTKVDGIISDVYFPLGRDQNDLPQPIGVRIAASAQKRGIPFVLNTSGYHHGDDLEWVNGMCHEQGWELLDAGTRDYDTGRVIHGPEKRWAEAFQSLTYEINKK